MKHLLIDGYGIYDKNGIFIRKYDRTLSLSQMIDSVGYDLSEITNKNVIASKRLITNGALKKISINIINNEANILINKSFEHYDNIVFNNKMKVAVSNDGITWRVPANGGFIDGSFKINLTTTDISKMTAEEKANFSNLRKFIDDNAIITDTIIGSNFINYIMLKLNTDESTTEINTIIRLDDRNTLIKDDDLDINSDKNKITIKNTKKVDIDKLVIKINNDVYIKNTMEEF